MADLKDIYAAGGKLFYDEAGVWVKIGLVQDFKLKIDTGTEEVMDYEGAVGQTFDEIINKMDFSISFKSKQVNALTLQKMFMTTLETAQPNPVTDGIVGATTVSIMEIGAGTQWVGKMKFESNNNRGQELLVLLNKVSLKPQGELALLGSTVAEMDFTGKAGKDVNGKVGQIIRKET
ncbi:MAG: hypothetical protein JZU49_02810 [Sulfuricurvum sp.]|nr:hypothetical protein [Sulfuricurvum sp.]